MLGRSRYSKLTTSLIPRHLRVSTVEVRLTRMISGTVESGMYFW